MALSLEIYQHVSELSTTFASNDIILACKYTQQNSISVSHLLDTVTTRWLDSDSVVTIANCQQHSDWAAIGSVVTVLPAVTDSDYTTTV